MTTTTTYNYLEAVTEDVLEYINNEIDLTEWAGDRDGLEQQLNDTLFTEDSVTGNASGSYTFSTYQAEEYLYDKWFEYMENDTVVSCHDLLSKTLQIISVTIHLIIQC